jgi:hypothetical protein
MVLRFVLQYALKHNNGGLHPLIDLLTLCNGSRSFNAAGACEGFTQLTLALSDGLWRA